MIEEKLVKKTTTTKNRSSCDSLTYFPASVGQRGYAGVTSFYQKIKVKPKSSLGL